MVEKMEMEWERDNSLPKCWALSTNPRQSQMSHKKRVNEVFNLHFFLDFLSHLHHCPNMNPICLFYDKWHIVTYGLKTVQQLVWLDFKACPQGLGFAWTLWSWEEEQGSRDQSHPESIDEPTCPSLNIGYSSNSNSGFCNFNLQETNQII